MRISVIVPVCNSAKYLCGCLDSILAQSFKDFELLLIDDGSSDESGDICDKYALSDERIKVTHKPNGGVSSARNIGIKTAAGELIAFIDSDDTIDKDYLAFLIERVDKYNADLSVCGVEFIKNGAVDLTSENEAAPGLISAEDTLSRQPHDNLTLWGPYCKLFKRNIIKDNNITFDETLSNGEDIIFVTEYLLKAKTVYYDTKPMYRYISHEGSATQTPFDSRQATFFTSLERVSALLRESGMEKVAESWEEAHFEYAANTLTKLIRSGITGGGLYLLTFEKLKMNYGLYAEKASGRKKIRAFMLRYAPVISTKFYCLLRGKP